MAKKRAAKKSSGKGVLNFVAWLTGVLVSLAVGFSMTDAGKVAGALTLPAWLGGSIVAVVAGWIVVITTFLGVILAIIKK